MRKESTQVGFEEIKSRDSLSVTRPQKAAQSSTDYTSTKRDLSHGIRSLLAPTRSIIAFKYPEPIQNSKTSWRIISQIKAWRSS